MKLLYENTIDDLVAFNRFHCDRSPSVRRARRAATFNVAFSIILFSGILALLTEDPVALAAGAVVAVMFAGMMPGGYRRQVDNQARRMYAEGRNRRLFGP